MDEDKDVSPLFNAKLAEPDFRVSLATFFEAKRTFSPSLSRSTAQQASPRESGDKYTQSTGFATPCFPFTPWALFRCDRPAGIRTGIGMPNYLCNVSFNS